MSKNVWRVSADVATDVRARLLAVRAPRFAQVFCQTITMAYKVTDEYEFSSVPVACTVYGYHGKDCHEAFLVQVGDDLYRPDGKRFHITLSTAAGTPPVAAGSIENRLIEPLLNPVRFQARFYRFPLWKQVPKLNPVAA